MAKTVKMLASIKSLISKLTKSSASFAPKHNINAKQSWDLGVLLHSSVPSTVPRTQVHIHSLGLRDRGRQKLNSVQQHEHLQTKPETNLPLRLRNPQKQRKKLTWKLEPYSSPSGSFGWFSFYEHKGQEISLDFSCCWKCPCSCFFSSDS